MRLHIKQPGRGNKAKFGLKVENVPAFLLCFVCPFPKWQGVRGGKKKGLWLWWLPSLTAGNVSISGIITDSSQGREKKWGCLVNKAHICAFYNLKNCHEATQTRRQLKISGNHEIKSTWLHQKNLMLPHYPRYKAVALSLSICFHSLGYETLEKVTPRTCHWY